MRPVLNLLCTIVVALPAVSACDSDSLKPRPAQTADDELYWRLELNHHAVTLAMAEPYDTLQLVATPRNYRDETIAAAARPRYISRDVSQVEVTLDGMIVAIKPGSQSVPVVATLTVDGLTHMDSVFVKVADVAGPPTLATFSIDPLPPDSAKVASAIPGVPSPVDTLIATITDTHGTAFSALIPDGVPVAFRSSDTALAKITATTGEVTGVQPGVVTFYATTTVFGTRKADTLDYRLGWPLHLIIQVVPAARGPARNIFLESDVTIGVGGAVVWNASLADTTYPVDITFADPTQVAMFSGSPVASILAGSSFLYCLFYSCTDGGNLLLMPAKLGTFPIGLGFAARVFPTAGVYDYHSANNGTSGRITVVRDEP